MYQSIRFEFVSDLDECRRLWDKFSDKNTIDFDWNYRYTFFKYHKNLIPFFLLGRISGEDIGILPLQKNVDTEMIEFFGGDDTDDNKVLINSEFDEFEKFFIDYLEDNFRLAYLSKKYFYRNKRPGLHAYKYFLDLRNLSSFDEYIDINWGGESRLKFKRNLRNVLKRYNIEILEEKKYIDDLFRLNISRFGEESDFNKPYRQQMYLDLLEVYDSSVIALSVDGKVQASSLGIMYGDIYTLMNIGVNREINYIGKLLVKYQIDKAISKNAIYFDAGRYDKGWKEAFRLNKYPLYILENMSHNK